MRDSFFFLYDRERPITSCLSRFSTVDFFLTLTPNAAILSKHSMVKNEVKIVFMLCRVSLYNLD